MFTLKRSSLGLLVLALGGCGIVLGYGELQPVRVLTRPEGAELFVNGMATDKTSPAELFLHPKKGHIIQAKIDGNAQQTHVTRDIRIDVVLMDGILTLGIGLLVDYLTGALYQLEEQVTINIGTSPPPSPPVKEIAPPPPPGSPCGICGEPRGEVSPCPHCGMN